MSTPSETGPGTASGAVPHAPRQFDTCETKFFERGDESAEAGEAERFDDLDDSRGSRKLAPYRQLLRAVAVGSACLAVLGCVALWRGSRRVSPKPELAPGPTAEATPVVATVPDPQPAPPAPRPAPPPAAPPVAAPPLLAVKTSDAAQGRANCERAIREGRARQMLSACDEAFAADPSAADLAVAVAKAEFDRGHGAQALAWGKKAVAADPNAADAYVFIGGAEQNAGHGKAAKEAYRHYLELAPKGRYATDLRAIVGRL